MKNNITELVFILDRSGSMSGFEADTIGGFNATIEKQKEQEGKVYVSTVLFDNYSEVIHDRVDISEIKPMTRNDYNVRGCTALLDAIGGAIHHIGNVHKYARPEDVPEHTYPVPAGAWSDDTSMSIAAMDTIADGVLNWDRIMVAFGEWYYKDKYTPTGEMFDVGNTCSYAIDNYFAHHKPVDECGLTNERSNGNGSLMRIHPFALMTWFDRNLRPDFEEIIEKASALTHAHERSKLACKIYTLILYNLLGLPRKDVIMFALDMAKSRYFESPEYSHYERLFDDDFDKLTEDEIKSTGYVVDTLEAAVWCVLTTDSYKECVLKAVNLGDDTDTVAAIAGGLAGALYGYDAIPQEWRDTLVKRGYIEEMCERASLAWYTPEPQPMLHLSSTQQKASFPDDNL